MTTHERWAALLDTLEERVRRLEALTRGEQVPAVPPLPVSPGNPPPAELLPRAHALLARTQAAEDAAEQTLRTRRAEFATFRR